MSTRIILASRYPYRPRSHCLTSCKTVPGAKLTPLGREQSEEVYKATKDNIQQTAELIVTSPLRRPLSTMVIGYRDLRKRLEENGQKVVVLPQLQEVSALRARFLQTC